MCQLADGAALPASGTPRFMPSRQLLALLPEASCCTMAPPSDVHALAGAPPVPPSSAAERSLEHGEECLGRSQLAEAARTARLLLDLLGRLRFGSRASAAGYADLAMRCKLALKVAYDAGAPILQEVRRLELKPTKKNKQNKKTWVCLKQDSRCAVELGGMRCPAQALPPRPTSTCSPTGMACMPSSRHAHMRARRPVPLACAAGHRQSGDSLRPCLPLAVADPLRGAPLRLRR